MLLKTEMYDLKLAAMLTEDDELIQPAINML